MNYLFDTHTFIWWDSKPELLSAEVTAICKDKDNTLFLSLASVWEMQIKYQLGKLNLRIPLTELIAEQQALNEIKILPLKLEHVLAVGHLPYHHKDPFDRLLIAQAQTEDMTLLSVDEIFAFYNVNVQG